MPKMNLTVPEFPSNTTSGKIFLSDNEAETYNSSVTMDINPSDNQVVFTFSPFNTLSKFLYVGVEFYSADGVVRTTPRTIRNDMLDDYFNCAGMVAPFRAGSAAAGVLYEDPVSTAVPPSNKLNEYLQGVLTGKAGLENLTFRSSSGNTPCIGFHRGKPFIFYRNLMELTATRRENAVISLNRMQEIFDELTSDQYFEYAGRVWRPVVFPASTYTDLSGLSGMYHTSEGTYASGAFRLPSYAVNDNGELMAISVSSGTVVLNPATSSNGAHFQELPVNFELVEN